MHPFIAAARTFSFEEFLAFTEDLVDRRATSGPDQSDFLVHFTRLNLVRMKRLLRATEPPAELVMALKEKGGTSWWVITEAWCGDSAQNLPFIALAAERAGIPLRILLRDENPAIMDRYLTGTSRSIPKLIALKANGFEHFVWGPRPAPAQVLYDAWRVAPAGRDFEAFEAELHTWYTRDRGTALAAELREKIKSTH